MSAEKSPQLVIGGTPRADLMPLEVKQAEAARKQRRGLIGIFVLVLIVVFGGYTGASLLASSRQAALDEANAQTALILQQQTQYSELTTARQNISTAEAARLTATSMEIEWQKEIEAVVGTLPGGSTLTSLTTTASTPMVPIAGPSSPLEGQRVVELQLSVTTTDIPDTATWIRDLAALEGFVDATPSSVSAGEGEVITTLVLHLDEAVFWNRFAAEEAAE